MASYESVSDNNIFMCICKNDFISKNVNTRLHQTNFHTNICTRSTDIYLHQEDNNC